MFTIVFKIHYSFFFVLPIWLKISKYNVITFFTKQNIHPPKNQAHHRGFVRPIGIVQTYLPLFGEFQLKELYK